MKDGILILNKPQNWTSHDCVAVCRRATGVKKVGHGGTLDPMAEGLLPIFLGSATKIMEYLDLDYKTYRCTAKLGMTTDTQDVWGEVLEEKSIAGITASDIEESLNRFRGSLEQIPPKFSAVRIKGKRLYQYARDGQEVDIRPRRVHISRLHVIDVDAERGMVSFDVTCSKGTYIRSICNDLGEALGCGGVMASLCRTESGVFDLKNAVGPDEIKAMEPDQIEELLMAPDFPLIHLGKAELKEDRVKYFCNGNSIRWKQVRVLAKPDEEKNDRYNSRGRSYASMFRVYEAGTDRFLGIGYYDKRENALKADKIFAAI